MSLTIFIARRLQISAAGAFRELQAQYSQIESSISLARSDPRAARRRTAIALKSWCTSPVFILIILWLYILCWGEIWAFDRAIDRCDWRKWESWPADANPHHLVFVADPQLVDPHTYPGRPWPLSALTIKHTDLYMRRSYSRIQRQLDPNTIFFLGDLFDGGREWSTPTSYSPDYRYRQYGDEYWLREFDRFSSIFLREWKDDELHEERSRRDGRQIIASLPGNHDLGLGRGIMKPVRDRFTSHFGESNRIDVIANHTFISLDTISLTAAEQPAAPDYQDIWGPPQDFMNNMKTNRYQAISKYVAHLFGKPQPDQREVQQVFDIPDAQFSERPDSPDPSQIELPTVFLSHVPFYRGVGEPCGPLRERHPPTPPAPGKPGPVSPDEPNALSITAGYQYQNVLSFQISSAIAAKLDGAIEYVFSGDDHDYCEVVHKDYVHRGSGIREITVKSISEAMGVRKPGFLLVSLWNPINDAGQPIHSGNEGQKTLQTKLCHLPEEFRIVTNYAAFIFISVVVLLIRAVLLVRPDPNATQQSILPMVSSAEFEKNRSNGLQDDRNGPTGGNQPFASTSSSDDVGHHLSSRNTQPSRPRVTTPASEGNDTPPRSFSPFVGEDSKPRVYSSIESPKLERKRGHVERVLIELLTSVWRVASVVILWYLVLWHL